MNPTALILAAIAAAATAAAGTYMMATASRFGDRQPVRPLTAVPADPPAAGTSGAPGENPGGGKRS